MQTLRTGSSDRAKAALAGAFLFLLALWAFLPAVHNGFTTYDDPEYITDNPYVKSGLTFTGVKWAFSAHGANWHPITWLSHMLDGQLFGLNPAGHHFMNVLLHAANCFLGFWVLRKLTGAFWRSFFVALLFGLHPLRVESVAWAAERKDVLSVFFFLLALGAYASYLRRFEVPGSKSKVFYVLALILFILGLLSKSMLVTFPCVLLLLDYWPLGRIADAKKEPVEARSTNKSAIRNPKLVIEKLPFVLVSAAMCIIAKHAQYKGTALVSGLPLGARVENAFISYCRYLGKIFWPADLSPIYPGARAWPASWLAGAVLLLGVLSLSAVHWRKRYPWWFVGWFWYLGTLVPVIGIIQIGEQSLADRYTYIPSLGILIALVWGAHELTKGWRWQWMAATGTSVAAAIACFVLTRAQIGFWRNTETMFARAVAVTPDNTLALVGLGACVAERGQFDEAIALYHRALKVSPAYFEAHNNLGLALSAKGEWNEAIAEYELALKDRFGAADGHVNLGVALAHTGRSKEAMAEFQRATELDPLSTLAHVNLATLQLQTSQFEAAIQQLRDGLKHSPQNENLHAMLGTALAMAGQLDAAIGEFQTALKLNPADSNAAENLTRAQKAKNQPQVKASESR